MTGQLLLRPNWYSSNNNHGKQHTSEHSIDIVRAPRCGHPPNSFTQVFVRSVCFGGGVKKKKKPRRACFYGLTASRAPASDSQAKQQLAAEYSWLFSLRGFPPPRSCVHTNKPRSQWRCRTSSSGEAGGSNLLKLRCGRDTVWQLCASCC